MAALLKPGVLSKIFNPVTSKIARAGFAKNVITDQLTHATGEERMEMIAILNGIEDPYRRDYHVLAPGEGCRENPVPVPSNFDTCTVLCLCHEDMMHHHNMLIYKGHPRRCYCGHWFKLVPKHDFTQDLEYDLRKLGYDWDN